MKIIPTIFILATSLVLMIESLDQACKFESRVWYLNSNDGATGTFWSCVFYDQKLNAVTPVNTITRNNSKTDLEVTAILYEKGNVLKFWPSSIFTKFPNAESFKISEHQGLEVIQPEYFTGAKKLKMVKIVSNNIVKLDADLFVQASNLEHINLSNNRIAIIHKSTFSGLPKLINLYLSKNKITTLHHHTFQHLKSLLVLDLLDNNCINQKFGNANKKPQEMESAIGKLCGQGLIEEQADKEKIKKLTEENLKLNEDLKELRNSSNTFKNQVQNLTEINANLMTNYKDVQTSLTKCKDSKATDIVKPSADIDARLNEMQKQINQLSKNCGECKNDLVQADKKSSDNYLTLLKFVQNHESKTQNDSLELSKTCKKRVFDLEAIMSKAAKNIELRLNKIEKGNTILDTRIMDPFIMNY